MEPTKLKLWGKETLKKPDWDFSEFSRLPKTAISRIFLWELDRELGSEKGSFLSEKANRDYYVKCKKSLRQSDVLLETSGNAANNGGPSTNHSFRVNWAATKPDLIAAFSDWLDHNPTPFSTFPTKTRGRPRRQFTLLEKISIHRFQRAGYSGGPRFFREVAIDSYRKSLRRINWTLVKREMALIIKERQKELKSIEKKTNKDWRKFLY